MKSNRSPLETLLDNVNVERMTEIPSPDEVQERIALTAISRPYSDSGFENRG